LASATGTEGQSEEFYLNNFRCIPYPCSIAPSALPAPVWGPQTAAVTGKSGEEIWTDKYGRVKVQFWDREGKKDEKVPAGPRFAAVGRQELGSINIPRIGQEVIVDFLEGDPDALDHRPRLQRRADAALQTR
jgi:type VI secretion system secreted protein VgrG